MLDVELLVLAVVVEVVTEEVSPVGAMFAQRAHMLVLDVELSVAVMELPVVRITRFNRWRVLRSRE
jgi:hypothetical protein